MWNRILAIVRTRLAGEWLGERGANLPVAPILIHAVLSAVLCGIAGPELPPYAYAVFALSIPMALTTLSLLGELGPLLRADPAAEWIGAQPVRPVELRIARVALLTIALGVLALGSIVPAALLAPDAIGAGGRAALILAGLGQTAFLAALLLWLQAALGERAEGVLVLIQTIVFCGVIVGTVLGLRLLPELAAVDGPRASFLAYPPAWFATAVLDSPASAGTAFVAAVLAVLAAAATLLAAPFPPAPRARTTRSPLATLLTPVRRLALRLWVRPAERASFEFVYEALPAERDFVIRTYPLVAVPLAFLLLGAQSGDPRGEGLLAILVYAPATYLPVLLVHVPATSTPEARWLLDTAPIAASDESGGALKAVAVRFLVPLFVALALVVATIGGLDLALRLTLPAAAAAGLVLRAIWGLCVERPPLSTAARELGSAWGERWTGVLFTLSMVMTVLAVLTWRLVSSIGIALGIAALAIAIELVLDRGMGRARRQAG